MWKCASCDNVNDDCLTKCEYCGSNRHFSNGQSNFNDNKTMRLFGFHSEKAVSFIPAIILYVIGILISLIATISAGASAFVCMINIFILIFAITTMILSFTNRESAFKLLFILMPSLELINAIILAVQNGFYSIYVVTTFISSLILFAIGIVGVVMLFVKKYKPAKVLFIIYSSLAIGAYLYNFIAAIQSVNSRSSLHSFYIAMIFSYACLMAFSILLLVSICNAFSYKTIIKRNNSISSNTNQNPQISDYKSNNSNQNIHSKSDDFKISADRLKELKELFDQGIISEEEFNEKRQKYISEL